MMKIILVFAIHFLTCLNLVHGQFDTLKMQKYIIGLNFRSDLPDSIPYPSEDFMALIDHFSYSYNYTEKDKAYLLKVLNDSFPEEELMFKYKIERYREDINQEVSNILSAGNKDSLAVLDSVYQAYYNLSDKKELIPPTDIDLMLGLANDARFIPFLEKRYHQGYRKAAFALARMGIAPYVDRVKKANTMDSIRYYGDPRSNPSSIHYNPNLLPYICSEQSINLYLDNLIENDSVLLDFTSSPLTDNDKSGYERNYHFLMPADLLRLILELKNSSLLEDYQTYIKNLKRKMELPEERFSERVRWKYSAKFILPFPHRANYDDLNDIRAFIIKNRGRLFNEIKGKYKNYWEIDSSREDFRVKRYKSPKE